MPVERDPRSLAWSGLSTTSRARIAIHFFRAVREMLADDTEWLLHQWGNIEALADYIAAGWPSKLDDPCVGLVHSVEQVAIRQQITPQAVRRRIQRGTLLAFRHHGRLVLPAAQFDDRTFPSTYFAMLRDAAGLTDAPPLEVALWLNRIDPETGERPADRIAQLERENEGTRAPLTWEMRIIDPPWGRDTPQGLAQRKMLRFALNVRQAVGTRPWYDIEREAQLPLGTLLGIYALSPKVNARVIAQLERTLGQRLWPTDDEVKVRPEQTVELDIEADAEHSNEVDADD